MSKHHSACILSLLALLIVTLAGCGDTGPATSVFGKVTVNGEPVSGFIHFVGADGKEVVAPIGPTGGLYTVANPPLGEVTVLVKGTGLAAAPALQPPPGSSDATKTVGTKMGGVEPPKKYAEAAGGLKYTVTAGKQEKNFELTPDA